MDFLPDIEKFKNFFDGTDSKNEISIAVEEAKKYDIFNLISRVSALNLFHQNQTKSVILDTYIEGVLCQTRDQFPSKYTISSGKFRKIINQISDTSLKYSIDPPENMFVQNIMFYGNYRVLNGIDQTPAYNLQHMISVLFAKGIEYPKEFLDATYILVNGMLEISEKIVGGILNTENNHDTDEEKGIMIPSAMEQYKEEISSAAIHVEWKKKYLKNEEKTIQKIETYLYNSHDQSFRYRIYSPEIELRNNTIKVMTSLQAINKVALLFMAVFLTGMIAIYQLRFEHREESYGISLAYGAQYKELYWEIFCEILLLNSIGTIIGIVIGYLVTYYVDFGIMISVVNVQGSWYTFLSAYGLCVVLSSFVSVITFRKLKKKKIIELLNVY